jgi:molecular chaperone HtpG
VLIEEHAKDLLPEWLRFVRGVVDSEDIQLNVSREMVQKTPVVRKIRELLVKRILKDLGRWARQGTGGDEEEASGPSYEAFWRDFGVLLKEGYYHERHAWGEQLLPLLRFNALSHDDEDGLLSLAQYKEAMAEGQDTIWFLTADSRRSALASPHLEAFKKKGYDVILLTDPVDEWLVSVLSEFDGTPVKSVARGELDLGEDAEEAEGDKADLTSFTPWVKDLLKEHVVDVRASTRLTDSACVLVDAEDGISANMERILAQHQPGSAMKASRVLEVNPGHPLIKNLAGLHDSGKTELAEQMTRLLLDDALLLEGTVQEPAAMGRRLQDLLLQASSSALA